MNVMLCGPMTDNFKVDWELFKSYETKLGRAELNIFNPIKVIVQCRKIHADLVKPEQSPLGPGAWRLITNLRFCLDQLVFCEGIYLMPDWGTCASSVIIAMTAQALGLRLLMHEDGKLVCRQFDFLVGRESGGGVKELYKQVQFPEVQNAEFKVINESPSDNKETDSDSETEEKLKPIMTMEEDLRVGKWFRGQFPDSKLGQ
jgi:hypothetical protein